MKTLNFRVGIDSPSLLTSITDSWSKRIEKKTEELLDRLTALGVQVASMEFATATYDGDNDVKVTFEYRGPLTRAVVATGQATLFIEYGTGTIGYGHPEPDIYGPGTWSDGPMGKGHWQDPGGWYYAHEKKTMGNPPNKPMYDARKEIENKFYQIAKEVFG